MAQSSARRLPDIIRAMAVVASAVASLVLPAPARAQAAPSTVLVLSGGTVFTSPDKPPITDAVVVVRNGRIVDVGRKGLGIPQGATTIDCKGMFVTAGFQNSHVHFTESKWADAGRSPADQLNKNLEEMLTRHGFTTVLETASFLENTVALRERIRKGEVRGPRILTAGYALYPAQGVPFYLRDSMPAAEIARLRTPASPDEAVGYVSSNMDAGADALKLFTVSWMGRGATKAMDEQVAIAAAAEAHRRGKLVVVHPSNTRGLEIAMAAKADILVHAVEDRRGWKPQYTAQMVATDIAVVPTLALFQRDRFLWEILDGVGEFQRRGGQVLFGTDVGFLTDYDPKTEYMLMGAAGLTPMQVLASLTTAPAKRFGEADRRGRIAPGFDADLVVLGADPRNSVLAFTQVKTTIRGGRVIYDGPFPR